MDDSIAALNNTRTTELESGRRNGKLEQMARTKIHIGSMIGIGRQTDTHSAGYITPGTGAKLNTRCNACKFLNHWVGDPECPMYGKVR